MVIRGGSSDLRIKSGNSLTLAPGVIVKMGEGIGIYASEGILLAEGTASQPVVFTSIHDDSRGGDTDGNGNTIDPMPGDWDDLRVSGTNNNTKFKYCEFYYGGGYSDYQDYTLLVKTNNTIIDHCTFAYNLGESLGAVNLEDASNGTKITNNIFYSNIKPLFISGKIEVDNTNVFHNPSEPSEINTKNGVFVNDNRIKGNINWSLTEVPFVMIVDIAVEAGNSLTLAENVTLKFDNGIALRYPGTNIVNYDAPGVYFTSYKDDEKVGDTNGDGSTSSPASGDWTGIYNSNSREYEAWPNIFYSEH
jgi:hypothetical protein